MYTLRALLFWKYNVIFYNELKDKKCNFVTSYFLKRHKKAYLRDMQITEELHRAVRNGATNSEIYQIINS